MTRWKAQGIAATTWFASALGLTFAVPQSHGWWSVPNFPTLFLYVFGPVALLVTLVTTVLVAAWRSLPVRALVAVHVGIAVLLVVSTLVCCN